MSPAELYDAHACGKEYVAFQATPSFPHACALFDTVGDPLPTLYKVYYKPAACRGGSPPTCVNCKERKIITRLC